MSRTIRQSVTLKATPHEVYEALMDSRKHSRFTGSRAVISRKVGGKFTAYDDYISGTNIELVPDRKIVQSWHASEWAPGHMSRVTFRLTPVPAGVRLQFSQSGVPDEFHAAIKQGWIDSYWKPLKVFLEK